MKFKIANCNNIDRFEFRIERNKLNVMYAINGTGKSTVSKALFCWLKDRADSGTSLRDLTPYKNNVDNVRTPEVDCDETVDSVRVFNEQYVESFVFQADELLRNSYEILIRDDNFIDLSDQLEELVGNFRKKLVEDKETDELLVDLDALLTGFGRETKGGIHKSSQLAKAFGEGNKTVNVPEELEMYSEYLRSNRNSGWIGWQIKGSDFVDITGNCPYCVAAIESKIDRIRKVGEVYDVKSIEHQNKLIEVFERLDRYFSDNTRSLISDFVRNANGYTQEQSNFLIKVRTDIEALREKFRTARELGFSSLKDVDALAEHLKERRIRLDYLIHLDSEHTRRKADHVNDMFDGLLQEIGRLQGLINQQKIYIERLIERHSTEINGFLQNAGFRYRVTIKENEKTGEYQLKLIHNDLIGEVTNVKTRLSFGERNAFALTLFMFDALKSNPDIIVLDDPVSSFDKNKKYALMDLLFRRTTGFRGKTVLLLTHDFEPVIDLVYHHSDRFDSPIVSFLENRNGTISSLPVTKSDIRSFIEVLDSNIANASSIVCKLIHLRRRLEILNEKDFAYHLLSSLIHKRNEPTTRSDNVERLMTDEEIGIGTSEIRSKLPDFDYNECLRIVRNNQELLTLYRSKISNYEKLQIYRIIFDDQVGDEPSDIVRKFINETFHFENDFIYQLDPSKYQTVPQYVIDECDRFIAQAN